MPFEPLRFLHASDVRLDHSLAETVPLPPRVASILIDATQAAFERLIAAAIEHQVDFLLLSGNTFVESERSLTARLALVAGFEQLAQERIAVFVVPGLLDSNDAWELIPNLPSNVTVLQPRRKAGTPVRRDGKVIAVIGASPRFVRRKIASADRQLRSETRRPTPFVIGALSSAREIDSDSSDSGGDLAADEPRDAFAKTAPDRVEATGLQPFTAQTDYLALGGGTRRTITSARGIAHGPGTTQGASASETGPRGGTLVTVETDGTVRCDFIATASVRWEQFTIPVGVHTQRADLLRACRAAIEESRWEATENAWIIEWSLSGPAESLQQLDDGALVTQLRAELESSCALPNSETAVQTVVLRPEADAVELVGDSLHAQFLRALEDRPSPAQRLADIDGLPIDLRAGLRSLEYQLDPQAIEAEARRAGAALFGAGHGSHVMEGIAP